MTKALVVVCLILIRMLKEHFLILSVLSLAIGYLQLNTVHLF